MKDPRLWGGFFTFRDLIGGNYGLSPERWERVQHLFETAAAMPEAERAAWLEGACGGDSTLIAEVREMLAAGAEGPQLHEQVRAAAAEFAGDITTGQLPAPPITRAGPYRLTRVLGRGGMGSVYLAERADGQYEAEVAVKLIRAELETEFFQERFKRERQALARLRHPNIARILDSGATQDGVAYIVMELVRGIPITAYAKTKKLTLDQILSLYLDVCSAVEHAHQRSIVHRDLKPGNILVEEDGTPKLLDFGICKVIAESQPEPDTQTVAHLMTPAYASPEQIRGKPASPASDIYSLGAILYELVTGRPPHGVPGSAPAAMARVLEEPVPPPSRVAKDPARAKESAGLLDRVILRALHVDPEQRYSSVDRMAEDIRRVINRDSDLAHTAPAALRVLGHTVPRWVSAAVLSAVVVTAGWIWQRSRANSDLPDVQATPLYLEAHRHLRLSPQGETREQTLQRGLKAVELFEQVAREQPGSARVWAGLAEAYDLVSDLVPGQLEAYMRKANEAATRGLQLNPRLDDLHHVVGTAALFGTWELEKALNAFTRAVELSPKRGGSHRLRAEVLCMFGRFEEALSALAKAQAIAPLDAEIAASRAVVYFQWRRYAHAAEAARQALAIDPKDGFALWTLATALHHQGQVADAEKILRGLPFRPVRNPIALAHLLAVTGRKEEALAIALEIRRVAPHPSGEALIFAAAGDHEKAISLIEEAVTTRDVSLPFVLSDPRYDLLRADPRYAKVCRSAGLPVSQ